METRILEYIDYISKALTKTHVFDIWGNDDIKQEIYILMLQAQKEFDEKKGDEYTFYFNYIKNRLSNFRRDNYSINKYKMGISDAISLEFDVLTPTDTLVEKYKNMINDRVDSSMRADYLRYTEGVKISHKRKVAIINHIKEIVGRIQKNEELSYGEA